MSRRDLKILIMSFAASLLLGIVFTVFEQLVFRPSDHLACSAGFNSVCIRADSREDFIIKDNCLVNRHDPMSARLCGEYRIYR